MSYIMSQILGIISYSLLALSFYMKEKRKILYIQLFAYIGFAVHYFLLNALTGTVCNILGFAILILLYLFSKDSKKKKLVVMIMLLILVVMSILSYESIFSLFPVFACLITFNSFLSKNENWIRFVGIISALCWLIYAIIVKSYSAIIFEIILVISIVIAYFKNKK